MAVVNAHDPDRGAPCRWCALPPATTAVDPGGTGVAVTCTQFHQIHPAGCVLRKNTELSSHRFVSLGPPGRTDGDRFCGLIAGTGEVCTSSRTRDRKGVARMNRPRAPPQVDGRTLVAGNRRRGPSRFARRPRGGPPPPTHRCSVPIRSCPRYHRRDRPCDQGWPRCASLGGGHPSHRHERSSVRASVMSEAMPADATPYLQKSENPSNQGAES